MFKGKVIRSDSLDPNYKVEFTYQNEQFEIQEGEAYFTRQAPAPQIRFNDYTDYLFERFNIDETVRKSIELEIGRTVLEHMIGGAAGGRGKDSTSPIKSYMASKKESAAKDEDHSKIYMDSKGKIHFKK